MAKYVIEDTTLTGIADAIRSKTGGTDPIPVTGMAGQISAITGGGSDIETLENLPITLDFSEGDQSVAAPEGYLVKSAIIKKPDTLVAENIAKGVEIAGILGTHEGGGSAETLVTLLEEQTLDFALNTTFNLYSAYIDPAPFVPVIGETYTVVWDGVEYECVAQDAGAILAGAVFIGNAVAFGLNGNNEPFIIGGDASSGTNFFSLTDTASSTHTVAIYQKASGGGGGSVEGIVYVTFMNGSTELCKTACMKGDSTVDPVQDGKIAVPTKDSTVSTVYTYSGWSWTDGGQADALALIDVTEDRTVYAAYTESVREYTVNFYDDDGTTLLESVQTAYGEIPTSTITKKDGIALLGWEPELAAVTGDADYTAVWQSVTFANATWAQIAEIAESGTAAETFVVGETKTVTSDDGTHTYTAKILAINNTQLSVTGSGSSYSGKNIVIGLLPLEDTAAQTSAYSVEWPSESAVISRLPSDCQSVIKTTTLRTATYYSDGSWSPSDTPKKIFMPTTQMCGGAADGKGAHENFAAYRLPGLVNAEDRALGSEWWLACRYKTSSSASSAYQYYVTADGTINSAYASSSTGSKYFFPCFCV